MLHLPTVQDHLGEYIDAGFPILYICTYEEANADQYITATAGNMEVLEWNGANCGVNFKTKAPDDSNRSLEATLSILKRGKELNRKLLVIKDAADQIKSPKVIALLKEIVDVP